MAISALVIWLGLKNGRIALYSLMDARLDPELETSIHQDLLKVKGVMGASEVRIRRAGPF